jgi:Peptidase family M28
LITALVAVVTVTSLGLASRQANAQATPTMATCAEMHQWVEELCSAGPRIPGTTASQKAAQFVHNKFTEAGLVNVGMDKAWTHVWKSTSHGLKINGQSTPASPIWHTYTNGTVGKFSTGARGITAEVIFVGDGTDLDHLLLDVRGKIVVANVRFQKQSRLLLEPFLLGTQDAGRTLPFYYSQSDPYSANNFPGNYLRAIQGGAVGFIGILTDYYDRTDYRNEAYSAYTPGTPPLNIPGMWMAPLAGAKLVKDLQLGRKMSATINLEGELTYERAQAVYGYLPGQSDETLLIQSHHDSNTPGAVEDASGTAAVVALAQYFAKIPASQRKRTLMFATMDTHFTDYSVHAVFGARHLLPNNPAGDKVVGVVTLEHIGNEVIAYSKTKQPLNTGLVAPRVLMVSTEVPGLKDIALKAMRSFKLERTFAISTSSLRTVTGSKGVPADSTGFYQLGLPLVGLVGIPLYLYSDLDTPDKVNPKDLNQVAVAFADIITKMSALPAGAYTRRESTLPDLTEWVNRVSGDAPPPY